LKKFAEFLGGRLKQITPAPLKRACAGFARGIPIRHNKIRCIHAVDNGRGKNSNTRFICFENHAPYGENENKTMIICMRIVDVKSKLAENRTALAEKLSLISTANYFYEIELRL